MALIVRVKPRAERQIEAAALWWSENRPAAPGAIRSDLKAALEALVEQPSIGTLIENARNPDTRRLYLARTTTLKSSPSGTRVVSAGRVCDCYVRRYSGPADAGRPVDFQSRLENAT